MTKLEIYDCTPRDGVQAADASIDEVRRKELVSLLDDYGMHFIEAGWPTTPEIVQSIRELTWKAKKSRIVAFGSTSLAERAEEDANLKGLLDSRTPNVTIFGKTWLDHVDKQLRITPEENLSKIEESVRFLTRHGRTVFYDAEHYFDGFKDNPDYAVKTLIAAFRGNAERFILCDTTGRTHPDEMKRILQKTVIRMEDFGVKDPEKLMGVHLHNDRGLALANALVSLPYVKQIQGTINGYGERVGNLNLNQFLSVYSLSGGEVDVDLKRTREVYEKACRLTGLPIESTAPFVGKNAFAHKGGVHVNAIGKGASYEHAEPERFGNQQVIVLNIQGGKSAIMNAAEEFGYALDWKNQDVKERCERLYKELAEMENAGYRIGTNSAEKYMLIERYFGKWKEKFEVLDWDARTSKNGGSEFGLVLKVGKKTVSRRVSVPHPEGPIDAGWKAFQELLVPYFHDVRDLRIEDYAVSIVEHKKEESPVRTEIGFMNGDYFSSVGVHTNILESNVMALKKGFMYQINKTRRAGKSI